MSQIDTSLMFRYDTGAQKSYRKSSYSCFAGIFGSLCTQIKPETPQGTKAFLKLKKPPIFPIFPSNKR